jgi:chromatin modification-related protein EAF6
LTRWQNHVEAQLHAQETTYLEETSIAGNIIKGFDNYIKSSTVGTASGGGGGTISGAAAGGAMGARRKAAVNESDRVFSRSSVSYMRDSETPTSATSTPNHVGTPTGSFSAAPDKDKKKKKLNVAEDSEADSRANKRQKFSFGATRKGHDD